jgi:hypothetical protein
VIPANMPARLESNLYSPLPSVCDHWTCRLVPKWNIPDDKGQISLYNGRRVASKTASSQMSNVTVGFALGSGSKPVEP